MVKYSYRIQPLDRKYYQILPSDLTLHYNLHVLCFLLIDDKINIFSLATITENKYFKCTEFSYLNESIKIGFIVYKTPKSNFILEDYFYYSFGREDFNL